MKNLTCLAMLLFVAVDTAEPAPITYQGRLIQASTPADGTFDFRMGLFDAPSGGADVGPLLSFDDTSVSAGFFALELDFGNPGFGVRDLWLEVAVRESGVSGNFTALAPRTAITAVPFSLNSQRVEASAIATSGAAPGDVLTVSGGQVVFQPPSRALKDRLTAILGDRVATSPRAATALAGHVCDREIGVELVSSRGSRFEVVAMHASEGLSELPDLWVAVDDAQSVSPGAFLNQYARLDLTTSRGTTYLGGLTVEFYEDDRIGGQLRHVLRIRPDWSVLDLNSDFAVFQDFSVPDIVSTVLGDFGIGVNDRLLGSYGPRPYEIQYDESPRAFVERLLARSGIFFSFDFGATSAVAELLDANSELSASLTLDYLGPDRPDGGTPYLSRFAKPSRLFTNSVVSRAHDPDQPGNPLQAVTATGGNGGIDYRFLGGVADPSELAVRNEARAGAIQATASLRHGASNATALRAGTRLTVTDEDERFDGDFVVTRVTHLALTRPADSCTRYANVFEAVPASVEYTPPMPEARRIHSVLRGEVVGPFGATTHTDGQGRIKVQFYWDRNGPSNENSSAFIRAMVPTGATRITLPEVGSEVLVGFVGGDPSRPVVLGSLFNGANPPQ